MKLTNIIYESILLEYSEKVYNTLIEKFSDIDSEEVRMYVKAFHRFSQGLDVDKRNIFDYSWDELKSLVDRKLSNQKVKAGKIGDKNVDKDDIIYDKDGITVYKGDSKEKCIRYGNGYNFCISSRGEDNKYDEYQDITRNYYFIFNKNTEKFDPFHLIVIQKLNYTTPQFPNPYVLWDARNRQMFLSDKLPAFDVIERILPWLKGLEYLFV